MTGKPLMVAVTLSVVLLIAPSGLSATTVNLNKARDLVDKGQCPSAIPLLEEILSASPDSQEAQYLMGVCHLRMDDLKAADGYFQGIFSREGGADEAIADQVGNAFEDHIISHLGGGQVEMATEAFELLMKYRPSTKDRVSKSCVDRGEAYLQQGQDREAAYLFRFAASYSEALKDRICDILFVKAKAATGEESLKLVLASVRYGNKYQDETTRMVLRLANSIEDPSIRESYLGQALDFIEREVLFNASVDYFTSSWGPPQRITLVEPGRWIGVEKAKEKERIFYLAEQSLLTRQNGTRVVLEPAFLTARPFTGSETRTDKGYVTEIWFSVDENPVTVAFWVKD
ncbi:MAG: tetratricopeptide repeat protein [bacterium]|nr:MAG: tetratricopeptide repeat protein [bacterium]